MGSLDSGGLWQHNWTMPDGFLDEPGIVQGRQDAIQTHNIQRCFGRIFWGFRGCWLVPRTASLDYFQRCKASCFTPVATTLQASSARMGARFKILFRKVSRHECLRGKSSSNYMPLRNLRRELWYHLSRFSSAVLGEQDFSMEPLAMNKRR